MSFLSDISGLSDCIVRCYRPSNGVIMKYFVTRISALHETRSLSALSTTSNGESSCVCPNNIRRSMITCTDKKKEERTKTEKKTEIATLLGFATCSQWLLESGRPKDCGLITDQLIDYIERLYSTRLYDTCNHCNLRNPDSTRVSFAG